jgi:hypothetical protein
MVERRAWVFEERSGCAWLLVKMQRNRGGLMIVRERDFVKEDGVAIIWNRRGGIFAITPVA